MTELENAKKKGRSGGPSVAVALEGDDSGGIPRISATGRGTFADRLVEVALENGVKVREDADLAEILTAFDVDSPIPMEAFEVVAEILAYVYRANGQDPGTGPPLHRQWASELIRYVEDD